MRRLVSLFAFVLSCSVALSAGSPKVKVTVLRSIPVTSSYNWQVAGQSSVACYSSGCSSYFSPSEAGTANVQGAVLKLLLPDGRIVIAECLAKADVGRNLGAAMAGTHASTMYRNCRMPEANTGIEAEFNHSLVKLFIQAPSIDGTGKISGETYQIKGVLQPTASSQMESRIAADPELKKQLETNDKAGLTSPAAAAAQINNEHPWSSMTPAERTQVIKDGKASLCMVLTTPAGAEIDIDGNRAGVSPMKFALMRHGDDYRTITIKMVGYVTVERKFLPDGKDIPIGITLEPETKAGTKP